MASRKNQMITAGIDVGSLTAKAVVLYGDRFSFALRPTGIDIPDIARQVTEEALEKADLTFEDIERIVSTGYGRISIPFTTDVVTEITCNAVGVHHFYPNAGLVLDIGGQDSKVIKVSGQGRVLQFAMNDKCAAGTGKFLEVAAETLRVDVSELGEISSRSEKDITISNTCTVFAQTEIVSLIAQGAEKEDIAAGLHLSIVNRVYPLINSVNPDRGGDVVMTGGVARNTAIVRLLERTLGRNVFVPDNPQIVTAYGAALLARGR
jgi:predicted CoA-substrate-specific enzyme activase